MSDAILYAHIGALPDNLKAEVADFVAFLEMKHLRKENDNPIPQWQQDDALARLAEMDRNPEAVVDWDTAIAKISKLAK